MASKGYTQYLTDEGHYFTINMYEPEGSHLSYVERVFPGEAIVWYNQVDQTNGSHNGTGQRIDGFVSLVRVDEMPFECPTCGHINEDVKYVLPGVEVGHHLP